MPNRDRPDRNDRDDRNDRNDRNDIDAWLHGRIEPLPPPPGTFTAIRRRARHRKLRKLVISAGAATVVIAAAVAVPQVVQLPIETGKPEAGTSPLSQTPASATGGAGVQATTTSPALVEPPAGNPVPHNFQASSATAVSPTTVFTIGQAGTPGQCSTQYCTSVAQTRNAGRTWTGLPAPGTGAPDGSTGVGQIRFLDGVNGWAFGPELWSTHDGATTWSRLNTHGQRVIDVETVGNRAFAVEAACTGTGPDFAARCTSFTLYSTPATVGHWTTVGAATTGLTARGGTGGSAALVLTSSSGYLLAPDGTLYAGPVTGAAWHAVGTVPCGTGRAQPDGEPSGALLGAASAQNLLLACTQSKRIYVSSNAGKSWQQMWTIPKQAAATSIAASPADGVVLGTSEGIEVLPSQGSTWRPASIDGATPAAGFSFVGMTTDTNGMALPADPADGTIWFTSDGGLTWRPSGVQSPA